MNNNKLINVAIAGASGYIGVELCRLLCKHPLVNIVSLSANRSSGKKLQDIWTQFRELDFPVIENFENWHNSASFAKVDAVFLALPHGLSQSFISKIYNNKIAIFDLGADFRLHDSNDYKKWYGSDHKYKELLDKAVYGLSEVYFSKISKSNLIACPGCYPTSILLPIIPLLKEGLIEANEIIVDSKSGISGAGRTLLESNLFAELNENVKAYGLPHRHTPEIEQELSLAANQKIKIRFTPHLVPMQRGIYSTIYLKAKFDDGIHAIHNLLENKYRSSPFISVLDMNSYPESRFVINTNKNHISVCADGSKKNITIFSTIDNLIKGASGQAIQNFNIRFNFPATTGLFQDIAILP